MQGPGAKVETKIDGNVATPFWSLPGNAVQPQSGAVAQAVNNGVVATVPALEAKGQKPNIHWLLDVDDTLMVMDENGNFIFNDEFIDELVKWGVKEVSLLTKMDARHVAFNSKIRIPLIEYLESKGIKVVKVITTVDVSCKKTAANPDAVQTGYAYETLMKPVERALLKVKQTKITKESFNKFELQETNKNKLKALEFILNANIVKPGDKVPGKSEDGRLVQDIEKYIAGQLAKGELKLDGVDFDFVVKDFKQALRATVSELAAVKNDLKFQDILVQWTQEAKPTEEAPSVVQEFFAERLKYRNQNFLMHLKAEQMEAKKDGVPKQNDAPKENTKGQAYSLWVNESKLSPSDTVIFVDDYKKEQDSVLESHLTCGYKHFIHNGLPFMSEDSKFRAHTRSGFECYIEQYERSMVSLLFLPSVLRRHEIGPMQATRQKCYLFNCVQELNERGLKAAGDKKFNIAIRCFEIAYLISAHVQIDFIEAAGANLIKNHFDVVPGIIANIAKARRDAAALKEGERLKFGDNDLQLDSLYQELLNIPAADMQFTKIEMESLVFQHANPSFYKKPSLLSTSPDKVDREFENRIVKKAQWLAVTFPVAKDKCVAFLTSLKGKIYPQVYKDCVQKAIDGLPALIQAEQARVAQHAQQATLVAVPR